MGVTLARLRSRIAALALTRVHVLVVEVPGWSLTRMAVERAYTERGWSVALSPADADLLVVAGVPGHALGRHVDQVWEQLPGPRARIEVTSVADVPAAFDRAVEVLLDDEHQRQDTHEDPAPAEEDHAAMEGMDDHAAMEGKDDDSDMGGMHGMHDMEMPAGIPLAGEGPDRDGLDLDELHVPLGPVLPHWPAGLVLHTTLQGDVVVAATVEVLGSAQDTDGAVEREGTSRDSGRLRAARQLDSASRLLSVAGWDDAAVRAARLRDDLLGDASVTDPARRLDRLSSTVSRNPALRWLLRDLGRHDSTGDVHDRLLAMLTGASAALTSDADADADTAEAAGAGAGPSSVDDWTDLLPTLVTGLDLAAARLVVASLDPDTSDVAAHRTATHG